MKTIVLAYDESEPSKHALERTVELAKAFGSMVLVTSVYPLTHSGPRFQWSGVETQTSDPEESLNAACAALEERGITNEEVAVTGDPSTAITRLAAERDADLVVVGTREPTVVQRLMRQSVSQAVAKKVHTDLLIVHPPHRG
jgi:nucleotide-binding universal stress UspA family protein